MKLQLFTGMVAIALLVTPALARRGADDAPGHVRQCRGCDDGAGHTSIQLPDLLIEIARRGRGADDPAGHVRGEGAGHASIVVDEFMQMARRGADDAPGHVRQCRGCDDGANHT